MQEESVKEQPKLGRDEYNKLFHEAASQESEKTFEQLQTEDEQDQKASEQRASTNARVQQEANTDSPLEKKDENGVIHNKDSDSDPESIENVDQAFGEDAIKFTNFQNSKNDDTFEKRAPLFEKKVKEVPKVAAPVPSGKPSMFAELLDKEVAKDPNAIARLNVKPKEVIKPKKTEPEYIEPKSLSETIYDEQ